MNQDKEEEEKIAQEIVQDKSSHPEEAEVKAKVSKEIEMRYLSFLNFYLEKEKLWLLINSILRACSQQGDLIVK